MTRCADDCQKSNNLIWSGTKERVCQEIFILVKKQQGYYSLLKMCLQRWVSSFCDHTHLCIAQVSSSLVFCLEMWCDDEFIKWMNITNTLNFLHYLTWDSVLSFLLCWERQNANKMASQKSLKFRIVPSSFAKYGTYWDFGSVSTSSLTSK
jgi:hypothetical protein